MRTRVVAEQLRELQQQGYTGAFCVDADGALCCPVCGTCQPPTQARLDEVRPCGDGVVLAVSCPACLERGTAAAQAGAAPGDDALLAALPTLSPAPSGA